MDIASVVVPAVELVEVSAKVMAVVLVLEGFVVVGVLLVI